MVKFPVTFQSGNIVTAGSLKILKPVSYELANSGIQHFPLFLYPNLLRANYDDSITSNSRTCYSLSCNSLFIVSDVMWHQSRKHFHWPRFADSYMNFITLWVKSFAKKNSDRSRDCCTSDCVAQECCDALFASQCDTVLRRNRWWKMVFSAPSPSTGDD